MRVKYSMSVSLLSFSLCSADLGDAPLHATEDEAAQLVDNLVGLQVPKGERAAFQRFLDELGYRYRDETDNPAYRLFLG